MNPSRLTPWECPPKTVLVGVDFGDASARALAIAGVVASTFDAGLRALHAERFEPPPYFTIEQIARLEAERSMAQAAAADHLTRFAAGASGSRVESLVVDEPPVEALLEAAASADLIVVGTHGRRGPGRWWLGSVAERVVRAAAIPVLVTRRAATPPRDVFSRVALVHNGDVDATARTCAGHLAGIVGGTLIDAGPITQCDASVMQQASMVVVPATTHASLWGMTDPIAQMLAACQRPVLFIPAR